MVQVQRLSHSIVILAWIGIEKADVNWLTNRISLLTGMQTMWCLCS